MIYQEQLKSDRKLHMFGQKSSPVLQTLPQCGMLHRMQLSVPVLDQVQCVKHYCAEHCHSGVPWVLVCVGAMNHAWSIET